MKRNAMLALFVLFLAIIVTGCKKDDNPVTTPPPTGSTTWIGTLANASETGSFTLTFSSAIGKLAPRMIADVESVITVSGSIKIGSTTILLNGTYETTTDSLYVTGGGYTFTGKLNSGHITGTYTGPNGPGGFSASPSTSEGSVKVYCGTYHETSPDTSVHGRFNLVITGGASVSGITDSGLELGGSVVGTTVHVTIQGIQIATGTITDASISGTYSVPDPEDVTHTGTWDASICQ